MSSETEEVMRTFCRLCEVGCGLVATVENGRVTRLRPDHEHPVTAGFACSKGLRSQELHADPDRVRVPQRRVDGTFVPVSWDDALHDIASRVDELVARHGPRAVGVYLGNPNAFNALGSGSGLFFPAVLGSDRMFSAVTQDCANKYAVAELLYGTPTANPIPDLDRTELLLVIGANPRVTGSSFLSVPDPVRALRGIRDRGGRVVFVNPLEVEPEIGETLQLRPDSDPYLLAALLHEIHRSIGFRLGPMADLVVGVDEVASFVAPYSPEAVADVVGLTPEVIVQLARDFAAADGASIHASTGLNMGRQGALAYWLVQMLVLLTGNLDRAGGSYFAARGFTVPPPPVDRSSASFETGMWGSYRRVVGMLPAAVLPEVIDDADEPLRALFVIAGNPALTIGGGSRLQASLASLDLLVCIDLYRNATGELADYILPATDQYEREDLNVFVQGVQAQPYVHWSPKLARPDGEQREEWRILGQLLQAMGKEPLIDPETDDPIPLLFDGVLASTGLSIAALRDAGGVITLPEPGPGGSVERLGISTPIECVVPALRSTLERGHDLFPTLVAEDPGQLKLITRRTRSALNSTLQNLPARGSGGGNPLWMCPEDAARLGLDDGDRVVISNAHGEIESEVRLDARLRSGTVAMTHGFGNALTTGMPVAQRYPGANVNALSPRGPGTYDPVSSMSHVTGIAVDVRPVSRLSKERR